MSSCNCIIMSFSYLIEPYTGFLDIEFQPYSPSLSHVQPCRAILYILCSLIPFLLGGDFPPSVDILHMCPCIEHRYVPLLGTSLFALYDRVLPYYTALLSTSCWMMGDALMPSFQQISSHRLQIIYSGIGIQSHVECLETCSHQWQVLSPSTVSWEYINVP